MALIHCNFFSEVLGFHTSMYAILPPGPGPHPTLYLLHGRSDDHTIWLRRTSIERYVAGMDLAVLMPEVHLSFYTDMFEGGRYWTFISEELPRKAREMFHLSREREANFAAGLSMGGYGAFKLAIRKPEMFAAAASLSGAVDAASLFEADSSRHADLVRIFGSLERLRGSDDDLFALASGLAAATGPKPRLFQCCGLQDFLLEDNRRFMRLAEQLKLDHVYKEGPGGHEWAYWDQMIQAVLRWLPLGS